MSVVCDPVCENGGRCRKSGRCKCLPGYYGPRCESRRQGRSRKHQRRNRSRNKQKKIKNKKNKNTAELVKLYLARH